MDTTNGSANGTTERCTGLRAVAARNIGLGTLVPKSFPMMVEITDHSPEAQARIQAEISRIAAGAAEKRAARRTAWRPEFPGLPKVETLPEEYLAACIREVMDRQERIRAEADAKVEALKALLKVG